jgi:hypothetical protein
MSEQDRQEQIAETLSLLGQLTPAALAADRDLLFFRAGEASARGENRTTSRTHRVVWPTVAAAALALLAAGLGALLVMREPEVRVVYIERPAAERDEQAGNVAKDTTPRERAETNGIVEPATSVYGANEIRYRPGGNGIIPSQDWAALSDAFAGQLRLQQARSRAAEEAMSSTTVENRGAGALDGDAPRQRAKSYLELRDSLRAM